MPILDIRTSGPTGLVDPEIAKERPFPNVAGLAAASLPLDTQMVLVYGYYLPGDCPLMTYRRVASEPAHGGKMQSRDLKWWELSVPKADLRMFGARGDYVTDDTAAVLAWLNYSAVKRTPLHVSRGVYRCTDNFVLPKRVVITGDGAPLLASFPKFDDDDKSNLRPGYKHLLNGASFVFSGMGTPTHQYLTARADKFASLRPCLIYRDFAPPQLSGFGIVQDMDVYTAAGALTTGANDNKAAGFTTGLLSRATLSKLRDLTVFGYFNKGGLTLVNIAGDGPADGNDPDYQSIQGCDITGGVAIVGGDAATPLSEGNTGSRFVDCGIFGADHHHRPSTDPAIPCLYVDVHLTSVQQGRGHTFSACNLRTVSNEAVKLGHCNDLQFNACVTEFSEVPGVAGLDARGIFVGTPGATQSISINGIAATGHLGLIDLADLIADNGGQLTVSGGPGASVGAIFSVDRFTYRSGTPLVVINGTIMPTRTSHVIDGTGNPTVTNIDPSGVAEGQLIRLSRSGSGMVTFNRLGNIVLQSDTRVLNALADELQLIRFGSNFREIAYVDNV